MIPNSGGDISIHGLESKIVLQISSGNISDNGQRFTNHSGMQKLAWPLLRNGTMVLHGTS